jgi:hypothetical protein
MGDIRTLKERTLGVEVFGRPSDYDTSQDPIVRASAAEIRKRLAQYYQEPGHEFETRIDLLSGSYIVKFHFDQGSAPPTPDSTLPAPNPTPPVPIHPDRRRMVIGLATGVPVTLLILSYLVLAPNWQRSDLERFWGPVLKSPGPVLFCIGQPVVYNLKSARAQDAIQAADTPPSQGNRSDEEVIPQKDLVILRGRYVALGDSVCMVRLAALFGKYGKAYRIRGEQSTSFADLRESPAVLIAAFDNQWTHRLAGQLRFTFVKDSAHDTDFVSDGLHPENTEWRLVGAWPYWEVSNDYAVLSRIVHGPTDHPVVIAAGITEYGTLAAGEFLSTPEYFAEVALRLPRGWESKNLQIVLRVPVVSHVPGHPQILATYVW